MKLKTKYGACKYHVVNKTLICCQAVAQQGPPGPIGPKKWKKTTF